MVQLDLKLYSLSSPVGVDPKPENCVFVPLPCEFRFTDAERSGREHTLILSVLTLV